jgi:PadR family transcriptional regulator, regulatory protein AphA
MSPMVRRALTIEHALLGFLKKGSLHGYQLHQQINDPAGLKRIWYVKQAQLYALLGKLEEAGYITGSIQQQETRPARRVFQLTRAGQEAFQNWLFSPVQRPRQMRQEFLAKLYFAQQEGETTALQLIASQRRVFAECLNALSPSGEGLQNGAQFHDLVNLYRTKHLENILDWLDTCAERIHRSVL